MKELTLDELVRMMYSGEAKYKAFLTINGYDIPNGLIKKITISKPIIDKQKNYFYLGTFISNSINISFRNIDEIEVNSGDTVDLYIRIKGYNNKIHIGEFIVDNLTENYYKDFVLPCLDKAVLMKENLDYSPAFNEDGEITIDELLIWICNHYGIQLESYPKINGDIKIGTYDSSISGKQWISYIAELKGCNAKMTDFNKLKLIPFKYKFNESKNKVYTYIKDWETGCYDEQVNKDEDVTKIRIPELISISENNKSYYFNTYSDDFKFTIVTFDENKDLVRYIGIVGNGSNVEFQQNEKYYGLSIVGTSNLESKNISTENSDDLLTENEYLIEIEQNLDFIMYEHLFGTGLIKPTVYYSNEQDKTFSEFKEIPIEDYKLNARRTKSWEAKEKYRVSKVTYYDAVRLYSYGTNGGNTLYIRQDNPFIKDETTIYNIYNAVKDTEYYSLTNECYGNILANAGDCILYEIGDKKYYTLYNGELTYQINVMEKNSVSIPSLQQEQTTNVLNKDVATNQKTIKTEIDLINASMKLQASEITNVKKDVSNVSQQVVDTKEELSQSIKDTEDNLSQNIQDTANSINQDVINKLKDYAKLEDLGDYVTTEKLESTLSITTDNIMQNVSKEISSTKTEINQTIETSISESEKKTNQSITTAIQESENKLNTNISNAVEDSENKLNQNINNAVNNLEQNITTTLTKYVTTEKLDSTIELTSDSILQSVSEDIETVQTNISVNTNTAINNLGSQINEKLNDYATTTMVTNVKNSVETQITSTQQSINVINQVLEDGVTKVDTKTGFTFDQSGLTIAKTNADTKTNINENGMIIYSSTGSTDEPMLNVNSNGVIGENMTVKTYLICGNHSRFENYKDGTGCFYLKI